MELKCFQLCFLLLFVIAASAAPGCKECGPDEKNSTVFQYKVKINVDGEDYIENITIDTKNQTETFHIPKMNSSNAGEVDVIYDFNRNLVMRRMSAQKACFLSNITENAPRPNDLKRALDQMNGTSQAPQAGNSSRLDYEVDGIVSDRSSLSDEMAEMCSKLPIYHIKKRSVGKRFRRRICLRYCYYYWRWTWTRLGWCYCRFILCVWRCT